MIDREVDWEVNWQVDWEIDWELKTTFSFVLYLLFNESGEVSNIVLVADAMQGWPSTNVTELHHAT